MSISWKILKLETVPSLEGQTDVATTSTIVCYWDYCDGKMSYRTQKVVGLNCDNVGTDPNFVDYANITEAQALTWTKAALSDGPVDLVAMMEAEVQAAHDSVVNPQPAPPAPVPWA